jgi:hypothetical protein
LYLVNKFIKRKKNIEMNKNMFKIEAKFAAAFEAKEFRMLKFALCS